MRRETIKLAAQGAGALGLVVLALWGATLLAESAVVTSIVARFGYGGVLLFSIVSGFNVIVPIPAIALLPLFTASGLAWWPTIFMIAFGMTVGDSIGYMIGALGRHVVDAHKHHGTFFKRLKHVSEKYRRGSYVLLFLYAAVAPAPNELIVIPLSFLGYRMRFVLPIVFVGNLVFTTLAAYGIFALTGVVL